MEPQLQRRVQRYGWDQAAEYYEDSWKEQLEPAQDRMMELADLQPGEKVIETACGTGLVTFRIANSVQPDGTVKATDLSDEMLEIAESRANKRGIQNVSFERMDAEELGVADEQFDAALCGLGLMYVPNPVRAIEEMHRVLKPGKRAVIANWGARENCGWAGIFPVVDKRVETDVCPLFFQQGTGKTLKKSFEKAGFKEVEHERFSVTLHYDSPEHAIMAAFAGGPVALAYRKFDEETRKEAHQDYLETIEPYRKETGYEIPGEFVIAKGFKSDNS